MKHLVKTKNFHRKRDQRNALMKILAHNLIMKERIKTTTARAKYLRKIVEKLITKAKKQDLSVLRLLIKKLPKKSAYKLFYEIAPRYKERNGGYLRVIKLPLKRLKDNAELSIIEFV
ncbi:MAG: 50S ribosomal protein L17 [Candidatus Parcubacteria bacterium]|nr:MAG: 50S ribosomal protein L17 [Candidatus Parcubacteria bacterium]